MNKLRYTPEQVIRALTRARGVKKDAARMLGCSRSTIDNYIKRFDDVGKTYTRVRADLVDDAMSELAKAIDRGEWPAVRFTLATLGKDLGFSERMETRQVTDNWDLRAEFEAAIAKVYGDQYLERGDDEEEEWDDEWEPWEGE